VLKSRPDEPTDQVSDNVEEPFDEDKAMKTKDRTPQTARKPPVND